MWTTKVPGTLSNLGPGFDVLGMAVGVWNTFRFTPHGPRGAFVDPAGPAVGHAVADTIAAAEVRFGVEMPHGLALEQVEGLPRARGLGSSATARIAGYIAWCRSTGARPPLEDGLAFLAGLEGHPDNVVAAMIGGCALSTSGQGEPLAFRRIEPDARLHVVLCIPERRVSTDAARGALPAAYPRADVVFNTQRLAFLMHGLLTGDASSLRVGMADRIHQPYRAPLIGPVEAVLEGACAAGAAAAFISGSGSTLAAWVLDGDPAAVAAAMASAWAVSGVPCATHVVRPVREGAWEALLRDVA